MSVAVTTYFWQPDPGSKFAAAYTADDVIRLAFQVKRNITVPYQFIVITDRPALFEEADPDVVRAVALDRTTHVHGTCFARLMTFHPKGQEIFGADKILQIDLDSLIVGNIDHLVARDDDLVLWRNSARIPWNRPIKAGRPYYNTSLLLHRCGTLPWVYSGFDPERPGAKDDQWLFADMFGAENPYFDGEHDGVYRIARQDTPGSGVWGALPANACVVTCPGSEGKASNPVIAAANPWLQEYRG